MEAKAIIELGKDLEKLEKQGCFIDYEFEITNIGIVEKPQNGHEMCKEYIDLEGRLITFKIKIPNKTMMQKLKELK